MKKIGRNDPCWCGSRKKYKNCHLEKSSESPLPTSRLLHELNSKRKYKKCFHPDASKEKCSKKIINAHSIQKNGPLKHIADETSHVYNFGIDQDGNKEISKTGWKRASTFTNFCGKHDKEMFSPVEDQRYNNSKDQNFLAGYRAYALEYYKKITAIKAYPYMVEHIDRGLPIEHQVMLQEMLHSQHQGTLIGIRDFEKTLDLYIDSYRSKDYQNFSSASFYFTGKLSVAVGGAFSPDFSIDGRKIQSLDPDTKFVESISINTLITNEGYAIVFSWPNTFDKCSQFIESLIKVEKTLLPSRLIEITFSYLENSYFSKSWIENLDKQKRSKIEAMARKPIQYGSPIEFSGYNYTDWEISHVTFNR